MKQSIFVALVFALCAAPVGAQTAKPKPALPVAVRFAKAGEAWGAVLADRAALGKAVRENRLADVHDLAFSIRDNVVTLPYKADGLAPAKRATLATKVAQVAAFADTLHKAADTGNTSATKGGVTKLNAALDAVAALFPANALPSDGAKPLTPADKALFLTPGGAYTQSDIAANGNTAPTIKYAGYVPAHDTRVKPGELVCPISETRPDPTLKWTIGGQVYTFCCPPCITEFLTKAKKTPSAIKRPEAYRKP